jgi:mannose-1-phosphate guanylyltransferase/mannose-6-phosphate isomerase
LIPVILSGGSGTRLWPVSRSNYPKQFCDLFESSLQSLTLKRCEKLGPLWIVTGNSLKTLTEGNLQELRAKKELGIDGSKVEVIYEPVAKNTAPAVAVLAQAVVHRGLGDKIVGIFPSDHLIQNENAFYSAVRLAERLAEKDLIVTLGIRPDHAATGYGYIQLGKAAIDSDSSGSSQNGHHIGGVEVKAHQVLKFHEKPSLSVAEGFLASGDFVWNAGMFIFKAKTMLEKFKQFQPEIYQIVSTLKADLSNLAEVYARFQNISIDYAIMEKLGPSELACVPADMDWSDVGSWDAVAEESSRAQNIVQVKSENNFVFGEAAKNYSFVGVSDLILVDTADATMVVKKGSTQDVKNVVETLQKQNSSLVKDHVFEKRPWGEFEILRDAENFKSKVITVNPDSQLSYQSHTQRAEHWIITAGAGEVVLNDQIVAVSAGSHVHIPVGAKHRMRNTGDLPLQFVEVQLGTYFGEDDITRYQDDYQRS